MKYKEAIEKANRIYKKKYIYYNDIIKMEYSSPNYFDIVIFEDIINHINNPWFIVTKLFNWINPRDGVVVYKFNFKNLTIIWNAQNSSKLEQLSLSSSNNFIEIQFYVIGKKQKLK